MARPPRIVVAILIASHASSASGCVLVGQALDVMSRILPAADLTRYSTLLPYISPSGSAISSMRAPSGSRK
jgi:hypothetical protein